MATGDREKALAGLMYAKNASKYGWVEDVKLILFGPSERLAAEDEEVGGRVRELSHLHPYACKAVSDRYETSERLRELGVEVEYVGSIVSRFIKEGYTPLVW